MRIIFDIDGEEVEMVDADITSHIKIVEMDGKKRVTLVIELDDDMIMDNASAEDIV
tara:strand:+ start:298 stop:465 length:168 start_codon:yes stop_codon:yes gene_type:complete